MSSKGWANVQLGELVEINARSITGNFPDVEIEYIDTASVTNNRFEPLQKLKLSEAPSRAKRIVRNGDTILSTVRPNQRHFGFIRNPEPNTIASTGFAVLTPKKIHPEFLYYYISQDSITEYLNGIAETTTTTFPAFRPDTLEDLKINIPSDIQDQRHISDILSALDDKIELNRQINATLEVIAQAIFKEWFVDFNFPGATGEMVESKLGMIPRGWRVGIIDEIIEIQPGFSFKSDSFTNEGKYRVVTIKNVQNGSLDISKTDFLSEIPPNTPKHCSLTEGDILLSLTGNVGRVCFVYGNDLLLNQRVAKIHPIEKETWGYCYSYFRTQEMKNTLIGLGKGTAQQNLSIIETKNLAIIIPSIKMLHQYGYITNPLYAKYIQNLVEQQFLAKIRDALLPKLMRGEIEV